MKLFTLNSYIFVGECVMPIELLVPLGIFALGIAVAISLAGTGIDRIVEQSKK